MAAKPKSYRVTAPVVVAKTMGDHGWQYVHLQQGSPVPADAEQTWIECHLRDQMIAEVAGDAPPAAAPMPEGDAGPMTAQPSSHPDPTPDPPKPPDPPPADPPPPAERPSAPGRATGRGTRGG